MRSGPSRRSMPIGRSAIRRRMVVVALGFLFGFSILTLRCLHLHLSGDQKLEKITRSQYQTRIPQAPPRGKILDAKGEELAVSVSTLSLAVRPSKVTDRAAVASFLKQTLGLSGDVLASTKPYVWIKRHLDPHEEELVLRGNPKLAGLETVKESKRFYPNRELASQLLGAAGWDGEGLSGVELMYDRYLRGAPTGEVATRDARGQTLEIGTPKTNDQSEEGSYDLSLTISQAIQYVTESELAAVCQEKKAKSCTAVVMDPRSGGILAMASIPSFNPNSYSGYDLALWRNRAVTDTFEPGSLFKVVVAAGALESGLVRPEDRFFCEQGSYRIGSHLLHDHESYGLLSFQEILKVSSNIGIYKVGQKIGKKVVARTIHDFGFGQKTEIDYPGEEAGFVRPPQESQEIEFANMTFGQGIRVTPIQIASAFATIANGGVRMRPTLVSRVTDEEGRILWHQSPTVIGRVLSRETAQTLTLMMTGVTTEGGTGTRASINGYTVAGKTGTSQKVENGKYSHTKFVGSFVGFVPAEDPRVVVLVVIDEPQGEYYGGLVAAPVFRRIAWAALREMGVPPPRPVLPVPLQPAVREASLLPFISSGTATMPDLRGLSKRQALSLLDGKGIVAEALGSGVVVAQDPLPGASLQGNPCRLTLSTEP